MLRKALRQRSNGRHGKSLISLLREPFYTISSAKKGAQGVDKGSFILKAKLKMPAFTINLLHETQYSHQTAVGVGACDSFNHFWLWFSQDFSHSCRSAVSRTHNRFPLAPLSSPSCTFTSSDRVRAEAIPAADWTRPLFGTSVGIPRIHALIENHKWVKAGSDRRRRQPEKIKRW